MTLRRRVAPVLPFGWPADPGQRRALALDVWLCVAVFGRFCFYRQSGGRDHVNDHGFRSMTLRRRVFPVWLFIGALSLSRKWNRISMQQAFYLFNRHEKIKTLAITRRQYLVNDLSCLNIINISVVNGKLKTKAFYKFGDSNVSLKSQIFAIR